MIWAMDRIDIGKLEDGLGAGNETILCLDGHPFSGVACELDANGSCIAEQTYKDGVLHGPETTWHPNGVVASETDYVNNRIHGLSKEWYESGQPMLEGAFEHSFAVWRKQWDEAGNLIEDYRVDRVPEDLERLEMDRRILRPLAE